MALRQDQAATRDRSCFPAPVYCRSQIALRIIVVPQPSLWDDGKLRMAAAALVGVR